MKLFKFICGFTCVCFCVITVNAFADARGRVKQRLDSPQERGQLINRVQNDISRLQDRFANQQTMKELDEMHNNYYPRFDNGKAIEIKVLKDNINAKFMSLDKNNYSNTPTVLQEKLSKLDMESKANELNIEFKRKLLAKKNILESIVNKQKLFR